MVAGRRPDFLVFQDRSNTRAGSCSCKSPTTMRRGINRELIARESARGTRTSGTMRGAHDNPVVGKIRGTLDLRLAFMVTKREIFASCRKNMTRQWDLFR